MTARVRAVLRRGRLLERLASPPATSLRAGTLIEIDEEACEVRFKGVRLELTRYEYRLLVVLARRPGRVYSRDALMSAVWEDPGASMDRTVDAHIKMLRAKLRAIDDTDSSIVTHRGLGYSWSHGHGGNGGGNGDRA